jgi:hypothetical protein
MVKKAGKQTAESEPLKLFYIFYNQERWDNWIRTLGNSSFETDPKSDEMPEGFRVLDNFSIDITLEVLRIIRLYQNKRFSKEEADRAVSLIGDIVLEPEVGKIYEGTVVKNNGFRCFCSDFTRNRWAGSYLTIS